MNGNASFLEPVLFLALLGVAMTLVLYRPVMKRKNYWAQEVAKVRGGGYVPPPPKYLHALIMRLFCIAFAFVEVGPIRIVGKYRLPKNGPTIIAPFHVDAGDASVVSALIGIKPMYYLIRTTEVLGWRGWLAAMTGAIAVDEESQEGRTKAFKSTVNALVNGGPNVHIVIFPQGQLVPDEEVRRHDFKSGTMAIARIAARKRKEPIWIVPVGIHYKTEPEEGTLFQHLVERLGFKKFRNLFGRKNYGAYAVIGKPFQITPKAPDLDLVMRSLTLEDDADKATDTYVKRLKILQKTARQKA
ncbi:MAG TPA: lysophospholipid acyltransferase family protein [Candidatus Obscuribacterales bacterium]